MGTDLGLPAGYRERLEPVYYLDDVPAARGVTFQPDVYALAEWLADGVVVDIGAGFGDKLAAMHGRHPSWAFTGIDYGDNLAHCRAAHPWADWHDVNLETVDRLPIPPDAVVIFSDVLEHLIDPTAALTALKTSPARLIILSTPERDVEHGPEHRGPSPNICHVREWNAAELDAYLTRCGFDIVFHGLTRGSDQGWAMGTQLVVMTP